MQCSVAKPFRQGQGLSHPGLFMGQLAAFTALLGEQHGETFMSGISLLLSVGITVLPRWPRGCSHNRKFLGSIPTFSGFLNLNADGVQQIQPSRVQLCMLV